VEVHLRDGLLRGDAIDLECVVRSCNVFREDEVEVALELVQDALDRGEQSEYKFIVAHSGERVLGYSCYRKIACTVHSFEVCWIAVDPACRRLGVGRRLLATSEERIRLLGGTRAYIETSSKAEYEAARRFYEGCGYTLECRLTDFYARGDDKLILKKVLESCAGG
jgi:ribosomal protein S18 acetylase RimI-like enzyme